MKSDFEPIVDHRFSLRADWGTVECQVLEVEPNRILSYTWTAHGLQSVVTWPLTPTSGGTHLRMEQSGFRPDQDQFYHGARGTRLRPPGTTCAPVGSGMRLTCVNARS